MAIFCKVEAEITIDNKVVKSKVWPECDIMKTSVTRAWTTRQFNAFLKDFANCDIGKDKIIRAFWVATYGEAQGYSRHTGYLSGVNGHSCIRRGVFEE